MAGRKFALNTGPVSLAASATVYLVGVKAPTTHGIILTAMEVSFEGAGGAATEKAVKIEYCTGTTDGTGTLLTVVNADRQDDGSPATTSQKAYSIAPSGSEIVIRTKYTDANKTDDSFPGAIRLKAGEVFYIRLTAPAGLTTVNASAFVGGDE
jgi:hypothetical protein